MWLNQNVAAKLASTGSPFNIETMTPDIMNICEHQLKLQRPFLRASLRRRTSLVKKLEASLESGKHASASCSRLQRAKTGIVTRAHGKTGKSKGNGMQRLKNNERRKKDTASPRGVCWWLKVTE